VLLEELPSVAWEAAIPPSKATERAHEPRSAWDKAMASFKAFALASECCDA